MDVAKNVSNLSAAELAEAIRSTAVTCREAVEASLARIAALEDDLQAFITVDAAAARATADALDARRSEDQKLPPLHGVPVAIKDVSRTASLRTTWGSSLRAECIPDADDEAVARLRRAGAVIIGKTNTPEFAFGAVCTNRLRGPTRNPWNYQVTSGGSSGGSAVAVATGMVSLAQGTDFGGSVRTPASFCGCVGLRPTPGLIPEPERPLAWNTLSTQGVLARSVDDAALMLGAMAGPHQGDPTSLLDGGRATCVDPIGGKPRRLCAAASQTLNGAFRTDPAIKALFTRAVSVAATTLGPIENAAPDMTGASDAFKTLRAAASWHSFGQLVEMHSDLLAPSFVWNVRQGREILAADYLMAEEVRSRVYRAAVHFFEDYDILMVPAASVLPFPNDQEEVRRVDDQPCETIIDYLACTYLISLIGFPAIVLPALWTEEGLPFGVQLIARPYAEATLLTAARRLERAGFRHRWPPEKSWIKREPDSL